jgi:hypothetical protein
MTDLSDSNKCIVLGCKNHKNEGRFIGKVCGPCNDMLVSGKPKYGQTFVHEMQALVEELSYIKANYYLQPKPKIQSGQWPGELEFGVNGSEIMRLNLSGCWRR